MWKSEKIFPWKPTAAVCVPGNGPACGRPHRYSLLDPTPTPTLTLVDVLSVLLRRPRPKRFVMRAKLVSSAKKLTV